MKIRTALAILLVVTGVSLVSAVGVGSPSAAASGPCGTRSVSTTQYSHVIWVWMENKSYGSIVNSSAAPYENALAKACGLATNYHNITHPSLPNYIGATSGLSLSALSRFATDCSPSTTCSTSSKSVFAQTSPRYRAYEESMPSNCYRTNATPYAVRHNPPPYYSGLASCKYFDVPYTKLATDLSNNPLPKFAFVTPNLCHDTHDCSVATGDQWLQANLPPIFNSAAYRAGTVVLFLTWDEGSGGTSKTCASNTTDVGCHVANIVVSPSTPPGTRSTLVLSHYSMLRTTEQLLGVPALGNAATARGMLAAFNL